MKLEDLEKRVAEYRRYVEDCDASGLTVTKYAELHGYKREHYYHCLKGIRNYEAKKVAAQKDAPATPDSRLPILSLSGKFFHLDAYAGFDQSMALTMLAFAMQHEEDSYERPSAYASPTRIDAPEQNEQCV